jgi:hypothetical protein
VLTEVIYCGECNFATFGMSYISLLRLISLILKTELSGFYFDFLL